jgi:hypothetical protein
MRKCANISPYMRRPLVIYDFATDPQGQFSYLFYQCTEGRESGRLGFSQVGDGVASQKLLCTTAQDGNSSLVFHAGHQRVLNEL